MYEKDMYLVELRLEQQISTLLTLTYPSEECTDKVPLCERYIWWGTIKGQSDFLLKAKVLCDLCHLLLQSLLLLTLKL